METVGLGYDSLLKQFYCDKTVLITGHTGFKGSWLAIWLSELGARVVGYALDPCTIEDNYVVANLNDRIVDLRGDIRDYVKLREAFLKYKPDIVFHLAAQPIVKKSYEYPKETYDVNVMGTLNVLECIRNSDTAKVGLMITTDKCYENKEQLWGYRETDSMGGYDPYSSSKGCAELLISSYRNSYMNPDNFKSHGKSVSSARAGNVIGGGDWSQERLIPDCMRALLANKVIKIRNPEAVRPWQHVLEPLSGYMLLAERMWENGQKYSGPWNFGPDQYEMTQVGAVVDSIIKKWGSGNKKELPDKKAYHEAGLLSLDCTKARHYLGWRPRLNITQAIDLTVEWYKNYKKTDAYELCRKQIEFYKNQYKSHF